jgi:hypothetical protein
MSGMTFTITAHDETENQGEGSHRFHFVTDAEDCERRAGCVTLRTAQGLASELAHNTGIADMLRAIVAAIPSDYESLVGRRCCRQVTAANLARLHALRLVDGQHATDCPWHASWYQVAGQMARKPPSTASVTPVT